MLLDLNRTCDTMVSSTYVYLVGRVYEKNAVNTPCTDQMPGCHKWS